MDVIASEVGVRELKARLSAYLAVVESGREVIVTDRGRPVARLSPIRGGADEHLARLIEQGRVVPPRSKDRWLPRPRHGLAEGSAAEPSREQRA
jgi:prevent-host-death family protein